MGGGETGIRVSLERSVETLTLFSYSRNDFNIVQDTVLPTQILMLVHACLPNCAYYYLFIHFSIECFVIRVLCLKGLQHQ